MTACMQQKIVGWYADLVGYFHLILPQKLIKNRQYIDYHWSNLHSGH